MIKIIAHQSIIDMYAPRFVHPLSKKIKILKLLISYLGYIKVYRKENRKVLKPIDFSTFCGLSQKGQFVSPLKDFD
jgi:hypothetical protein